MYSFKEDGNVEIGFVDKEFERQVLFILSIMYGTNATLSALLSCLTVTKYFMMKRAMSQIPADASVKLLSKIPAQGMYSFKEDGNVEIGFVDKEFERQVLFILSIMYGTNATLSALLSCLTVTKYFMMKRAMSQIPADASVKLLNLHMDIYDLFLQTIM
uniref:Uncharacterized protein n=1 Tax=Panagrolaimus sp. ES5 TaxID=591445 RepID=A0AC34FVU3_9BILA